MCNTSTLIIREVKKGKNSLKIENIHKILVFTIIYKQLHLPIFAHMFNFLRYQDYSIQMAKK